MERERRHQELNQTSTPKARRKPWDDIVVPFVKITAMKDKLYKTKKYGGMGVFPNIYFSRVFLIFHTAARLMCWNYFDGALLSCNRVFLIIFNNF